MLELEKMLFTYIIYCIEKNVINLNINEMYNINNYYTSLCIHQYFFSNNDI